MGDLRRCAAASTCRRCDFVAQGYDDCVKRMSDEDGVEILRLYVLGRCAQLPSSATAPPWRPSMFEDTGPGRSSPPKAISPVGASLGRRGRVRSVSSGWLALLLLSSCSLSAPIEHGANVSPIERPRHEIEGVAQEVVGLSVENRPIVAHVMGEGPETFLLIGVIHGNEPAGKTLLERFMGHVLDTPALLEE